MVSSGFFLATTFNQLVYARETLCRDVFKYFYLKNKNFKTYHYSSQPRTEHKQIKDVQRYLKYCERENMIPAKCVVNVHSTPNHRC